MSGRRLTNAERSLSYYYRNREKCLAMQKVYKDANRQLLLDRQKKKRIEQPQKTFEQVIRHEYGLDVETDR